MRLKVLSFYLLYKDENMSSNDTWKPYFSKGSISPRTLLIWIRSMSNTCHICKIWVKSQIWGRGTEISSIMTMCKRVNRSTNCQLESSKTTSTHHSPFTSSLGRILSVFTVWCPCLVSESFDKIKYKGIKEPIFFLFDPLTFSC